MSSILWCTLFCLLLSSVVAAAHRPGFLYTRSTGRCTPQFWSGRREAWPRMVPETSTVSNVFGSRVYERYRVDLTLVEATGRNDEEENPFGGLVKEGSAALLNSYAREGFPYKPWQIKTLIIQALVSEVAAASQAKQFSLANQACF
ncbi:hypothetical protein TanjilG_28354 [Lupinus angustifolius]|uniref:Uncharacterized protein n=1 Tax=Lupinus angustifolius TaxID=3871 RepID=A0A4P1RIM7_LUPAN|nr:PREDICTED: uncharacterized protein LOC109348456 [Lupinus angustifolius]OIW11263.1 hypothetical protein TanjilG_28354 [Lupinus angustifolius]